MFYSATCFCRFSVKLHSRFKSNQIFHHSSCITSKRVTSWRSLTPHHFASRQRILHWRNVAEVASRWKHCVQFDRPEIVSLLLHKSKRNTWGCLCFNSIKDKAPNFWHLRKPTFTFKAIISIYRKPTFTGNIYAGIPSIHRNAKLT